jgi:phosphoribosylglycinamide formyltransferase 1
LTLPARLVVLISGYGSNLQAILDACRQGMLPAQVVAVFSNQPEAFGLERACKEGIPAITRVYHKGQDRAEYDQELAEAVNIYQPDWVVLAGWMRILSNAFISRFPNRVVNLHPALPGTFPGTHAIERAFMAFQDGLIEQTGVMVHLVTDEGVDNGPLLAQQVVPIEPSTTLEILAAQMHAVEHKLLVETLKMLIDRRI